MKVDLKYVVIALIIGLSVIGVAADPQILTYYSGYWFNDRMEEVNTVIVQDYYTVSNSPWVIYVTVPELNYETDNIWNNGETISIQKGNDTITITADTTTTLTVTP